MLHQSFQPALNNGIGLFMPQKHAYYRGLRAKSSDKGKRSAVARRNKNRLAEAWAVIIDYGTDSRREIGKSAGGGKSGQVAAL